MICLEGIGMSNFRAFWVNPSITLYFSAMLRHQGWFPYFSAGLLGHQTRQSGVQRKSLLHTPVLNIFGGCAMLD
jgi:hypothetical protein